jgi:hypothetical protein
MSQRVRQIHHDLVIADQWTEPHIQWQNPAELNGVECLKSHANDYGNITCYVDAAFGVHKALKRHTGAVMMLGKGSTINFNKTESEFEKRNRSGINFHG